MLIILAVMLLFPLVFALVFKNELESSKTFTAFLIPALLSLSIGFFLRLTFGSRKPNLPQAMLICSIGWLVISAIGALPLVIGIDAGYLDAVFETMSGFTTSGITVFTGLDIMPRSILFWRSLTQWVGGLGILTFFLAVSSKIPNAHLLFGAESHKISSGRPVPGMLNTVKMLWAIYAGFTFLIMMGLIVCGMSVFDSLCHSLTSLSTGGFSPHDASIAWYDTLDINYKAIQYVLIAGMILGGTSFLVHYRILTGNIRALWDNSEMKLWGILITGFTLIILFDVAGGTQGTCPIDGIGETEVRTSLFHTVSILTSTGF
ncbi:MAG: TrkH family potassium uptake protein, partial [FCB group bacterium]|nr:TrkH family potassium uptake protein [FCB group bacterium]